MSILLFGRTEKLKNELKIKLGEELAEDLCGRRRSGKKKELSVSVPKCKLEDSRETRGSISGVSKHTPPRQGKGLRMKAGTRLEKRYFLGRKRLMKSIKLGVKTIHLYLGKKLYFELTEKAY